MNPYAMQDRMQAEREAAGEAFDAWCESEGIDDPTPSDEARYERECDDEREAWAEAQAEARAEDAYDDRW